MLASTRPMVALVVALLAGAVLSGCGFQLRGQADLPGIKTVRMSGASGALRNELALFLRDGGVQVMESGEADVDGTLALTGERFERRVLSIDPNTGKPREYELAYTVDYQMTDPDGQALVRPQNVRLVRDFVFDVDAVIGKSREEGVLRKEMQRDAAQQILRRLRSQLPR